MPKRIVRLSSVVGRDHVRRAMNDLLKHLPSDIVVHIGYFGGLDETLRKDQISRFITLMNEYGAWNEIKTNHKEPTFLILDQLAHTPIHRQNPVESHHSSVVDIEFFYVTKRLKRKNVPIIMLGAISVRPNWTLPPWIAQWIRSSSFDWPAAARYRCIYPWTTHNLMRLHACTKMAMNRLTEVFVKLIEHGFFDSRMVAESAI